MILSRIYLAEAFSMYGDILEMKKTYSYGWSNMMQGVKLKARKKTFIEKLNTRLFTKYLKRWLRSFCQGRKPRKRPGIHCLGEFHYSFQLTLQRQPDTWASLREKVPNVLTRCQTKRRTGARGRASPSFGMTPTFQKKKKKWKFTITITIFFWYDTDSGRKGHFRTTLPVMKPQKKH